MESMRLNKYLAHCGVCSRREADRLIEQGKVSVNGQVSGIGQTVGDGDEVRVQGRRITEQKGTVVLAFYKPVGVTCTERDAHAEKIISDIVRYPVRVTYAGRLDKESEGLLLLSNDGDLIQGMMRGENRHEKEYLVKTDQEISDKFLREMSQGVYLRELDITTRQCDVEKTGKDTFRIVLTQGVNRQIRRMCTACGYRVKGLKRIRVMHVTLGELKPGQYRELAAEDVERLYRDCGMERKK
ncbi:MAG: pseudouridine synthase [bacterium]|nr:pseudouridine synthase [bacterium]